MTLPLHERIRTDIERRILSGAWAPGFRIPFEHELMALHGCSRMTVSKALSALAASGLIDRRRRAGSFVARPRMHSMILDVPDLAEQVQARGQSYRYRLLKRSVRASPRRGARDAGLDLGPGLAIALHGVHLADDVPLAVEHRRVSLAAVPAAEQIDFAAIAPGTWLLRHIPWTEAETRISAVGADAGTAALLGVEIATACLLVERRTFRGGGPITAVHQYFLGSAYDFVARFGPGATERPR